MDRRPVAGSDKPDRLIDFLVMAIPPAAAVHRHHHQRLQSLARRPHREIFRPADAAVAGACRRSTFPKLFIGRRSPSSIALSFLDSLVGIVAGVLSAAILMAYGMLGFAVLHALTRGIRGRPFVLGGVYALSHDFRLADAGALPARHF